MFSLAESLVAIEVTKTKENITFFFSGIIEALAKVWSNGISIPLFFSRFGQSPSCWTNQAMNFSIKKQFE